MSEGREPPEPATLEAVRATAERVLSSEEAQAYLSVPMTPEEQAEVRSLVDWFRRRYPTPAERLAYVRRAYRRWAALGSAKPR